MRGRGWAAGLLACGLAAAAGCRVVGPNYARPAAPAPPAYGEAPPAGWTAAQPGDAGLKGDWWTIYADPQLDALEQRVGANFSLQAAEAQFLQARALIRYYRADGRPTVTVDPGAAPQRESANRPLSGGLGEATFGDFTLPLDVAWEPDLWGRVRREVEQQTATAQSSAADVENARLSVQAEVAMDYYQARGLDAEIQLLDSAVDAYAHALRLTETRHAGGIASGVDVAQAQTQLETTRAQDQDLGVERAQLVHAIAVLVGAPPAGFALAAAPLAAPPPPVPAGVPAELLQRRPDIAAAERQVAAASAGIGVAKSAFYPAVQLSAGAGLESTSLLSLFTLPSTAWSLGANGLETIADGGRRRAVTEQSLRIYDQQVANYRQTVLSAFQEVEDNLAALRILQTEAQTEQGAVAAAEHSLALSNARYTGGVTTYLEVITAQTTALADERAGLDILSRRMTASVLLIKALGGGWNASQLPALKAKSN